MVANSRVRKTVSQSFPAAGYSADILWYVGSCGSYWTSSPNKNGTDYAFGLYFYENGQRLENNSRDNGCNVRPVTK